MRPSFVINNKTRSDFFFVPRVYLDLKNGVGRCALVGFCLLILCFLCPGDSPPCAALPKFWATPNIELRVKVVYHWRSGHILKRG